VTATIAWDIIPFTSSAVEATEGHEVSIDASEGDGESKKSSSDTHGVSVILSGTGNVPVGKPNFKYSL
jgi:hypothetical protein